MHLLLVRHGETVWNTELRIQGRTDTPLNARGLAQAERLSARLAAEEQVDVLYTSPLARACVTAEKIGQKLGLPPIEDERLVEQHFGELEGLTFKDLEGRYPEFIRQWRESKRQLALPGGETIVEFQCRVQEFLNQASEAHPDKSVLGPAKNACLAVGTVSGPAASSTPCSLPSGPSRPLVPRGRENGLDCADRRRKARQKQCATPFS